MVTTLPYFLIQIPALFLKNNRAEVSEGEKQKYYALAGFAACMLFFVAYMHTQVKMSNDAVHKMRRMAVIKESMKKGKVSLSGALAPHVQRMERESFRKDSTLANGMLVEPGHTASAEVTEHLKGILSEAFRHYDQSADGVLSKKEFSLFLTDFHESISAEHLDTVFARFDRDGSDTIDYDEFIAACYIIITSAGDAGPEEDNTDTDRPETKEAASAVAASMFTGEEEKEEEEEEEEVPQDLTNLSPEEQQRAIKLRAFTMLFFGTSFVLLFSGPMVDVLSEVADRVGVSAFYVSFVIAPLASNASEVIASQYYAAKKTRKTMTVALTALEDAAAMNNTLCLSIFMALIYFRGLAWQYTAETLSILLVQLVVGWWALRDKMSALAAIGIFSLFPLSVMFVALLEHLGMD